MDTKKPHIETLQMTIGMAMAEEYSPQNIEIPLEIKLPNGQTMYPACVLGGLPFHGQQQIAERIAAAWNAFTGIATTEIHAHALSAGGMEPLRKTDTAARGTDAQIIKERELCAYAFAGAIADGLSGGAGPDTQNAEWLRPAFEVGKEIAQLRAEIELLRKRQCLHHVAEQAQIDSEVQRDAERYRWLRNEETDWYVGPSYSTYNDNVCDGEYRNFFGVELDKAIDAARAAQGGV